MKKYSLMLLLFCSALILFNCQSEDVIDSHTESKLVVKKISLKDLQEKTSAYEKLKSFNKLKSSNLSSRTVYNEIYDFTVNTENILLIESGNYNSITFSIERESDNGYVENLFLHKQINGEYVAFLIRYDFDEEDKEKAQNGTAIANLNQKATYVLLEEFDSADVLARGEISPGCVMQFTTSCEYEVVTTWGPPNQGDLVGEFNPDVPYTSYIFSGCNYTMVGPGCNTNSSGGSGIEPFNPPYGGSGGSGSGGSSTPNANTNPSITNPVITIPYVPPIYNPCADLKAKTSGLLFNNMLKPLKQPNILDLTHETGFIETRSDTGNFKNLTASPYTSNIVIPEGIDVIGYAHVHNNDYWQGAILKRNIKMFSTGDLENFILHFQAGAIGLGLTYKDTYAIMISSEGTFALKMLTPPVDVSNIDWAGFKKDYKKKVDYMIEKGELNSTNLQKMFLAFLVEKKLSGNVALYKATNDGLTQWSRMTLNSSGGLVPTPCN